MKNSYKSLISSLVMLALSGACSFAQVAEKTFDSGGGTDVGNTLCYSIASANSRAKDSGRITTPVITYLNATSDKAGSIVQFYTAGTPRTVNYTNSTTTLYLDSTNTSGQFTTNGGIVVIRHTATDTYERRILVFGSSLTNLLVTVAPTAAVVPGDFVYPMTTAGFIPCGAATLSLVGNGIYAGLPGKPLLFELDGTSAVQVNAWAVEYK
jgi:hypothetical protein